MSLITRKLLATRPWHVILVLITFQTGLIVLQKYFFPSLVTVKEAWHYYPVIFLFSVMRNWPSAAASYNSELLRVTEGGGSNY